MGRVDEAMRRAAEAARHGSLERAIEQPGPLVDLELGPGTASHADPFPPEASERPRLRPIAAPSPRPGRAASAAPQAEPKSLIPPLSERLDSRLSRKVVVDHDMDPASLEQYRRLAAGLHAAQAVSGMKVVMIASAVASEGKSLTSSNLALTFSESYQRNVLLIDADLRRPALHTIFGLDATPGLGEGLLAPEDQKLPLHRVSPHLTVLTAGVPTSDPMAALASDRMHRLVTEARDTFDWVVIDTPPIGLLSDASLLSQIADGAIFVVKAGATPCDLVQRAVAALGPDRVLGVVLNRAEMPTASGYKYRNYYGKTPGSPGALG